MTQEPKIKWGHLTEDPESDSFTNPDTHEEVVCDVVLKGEINRFVIEVGQDAHHFYAEVWDSEVGQRWPIGPDTLDGVFEHILWVLKTQA